jgi:hypothetical protein
MSAAEHIEWRGHDGKNGDVDSFTRFPTAYAIDAQMFEKVLRLPFTGWTIVWRNDFVLARSGAPADDCAGAR